MAIKTTTISIRGITPLLMHNGVLADPLHESAIALAKATSRRTKTPDDHRAVAKAEFFGGLYVDETGGPCIPGEVLEACLIDGAKRTKRGKIAKAGIVIAGDVPLVYSGPRKAVDLFDAGGFVKRASVRVGQARIMRTRPMFSAWALRAEIHWDTSLIRSESELLDIVADAGQCGLGDWRPKFGRFELVKSL